MMFKTCRINALNCPRCFISKLSYGFKMLTPLVNYPVSSETLSGQSEPVLRRSDLQHVEKNQGTINYHPKLLADVEHT